jgi:hypothetical protein
MKRYLLGILLLLAATASTFAQTAIEFNDKLTTVTDELYKYGGEWGTAFQAAFKTKNFTTLTPMRKKLEAFTASKLASITAMKDVENSKPLRMAFIGFLKYEQSLIGQAFVPFEKFNSSSSDNDIKAAIDKLTKLSQSEQSELEKVVKAQEQYAKENGFTIEKVPETTYPN